MDNHAEYFVRLKGELTAAPQGQRGPIITGAAKFLGCNSATIYRRLEKIGWTSGRKTRSDRGKLCVDEGLAITAAGLIKAATRANGKKTLGLKQVAKILEDNGMGVVDVETGEVTMPSACTVARAMRVYGCHPDQITTGSPAQSLRSLHPNHVWEMDASVCVLFYLPKGKVAVMDEAKFYKNKPHNLEKAERARVIRWVITDHYSGEIFCRYTLGNEDAPAALEVLMEAMCKRESRGDVFHGVPFIFYTDNGSPFVAGTTRAFLQSCHIRHLTHAPGNARATGQVENAQNIVETHFEGRLRFLSINNLDELNAHLDNWRIAFNTRAIHKRFKRPRNQMWTTITPEQLRVPESPMALRSIVASPRTEREVPDNLVLSFAPKGYRRNDYNLANIEGVLARRKINVCVNPFSAPAIDVIVTMPDGSEVTYLIQPIPKDKAGFDTDAPVLGEEYHSLPDTATDKALKRMEKEAYNADTMLAATKARKAQSRPYQHINIVADVEQTKIPLYLPSRGHRLDLAAPRRELPPLGMVEAARQLQRTLAQAGVDWTERHMEALASRYPEGVPQETVTELADEFINAARPARVIPFASLPFQARGAA